MKQTLALLSICLLALALGCGGSAELSPGVLGGPCFDDGTCNGELICNDSGLCDRDMSDACDAVNCGAHGVCAVADGAAVCVCEAGFHAEGLACVEDEVIDPCADQDCSGHGFCAVADGAALCVCDDGYHDQDMACLADEDPCQGVTCSGHGRCAAIEGLAVCVCDTWYTADGLDCLYDGPPMAAAQGVSFTDTDNHWGVVAGPIRVERAADESLVSSYRIYWADASDAVVGAMVAELPASAGELSYDLSAQDLPAGAERFLVLTANDRGQMQTGVSCAIEDLDDNAGPWITFLDGIEVTDAAQPDVDGWYHEDGQENGYPRYAHEAGSMWIFRMHDIYYDEDFWVIHDDFDLDERYAAYYYHNDYGAETLPDHDWSNGSAPGEDPPVVAVYGTYEGSPYVGADLSPAYRYEDAEGDPEGASIYQWYRCATESDWGQWIAVTNGSPYTIADADAGSYLRVEVTPVAVLGTLDGAPVMATKTFGPVRPFRSHGLFTADYSYGGDLRYSTADAALYLCWTEAPENDVQCGSYDGTLVDLGHPDAGKYSDGLPDLVLGSDGKPWMVFKNGTDNHEASVWTWDGGAWQYKGHANDAAYGAGADGPELAMGTDGLPFVAYAGLNVQRNRVTRFDGTNWNDMGQTASYMSDKALCVGDDNLPLIAQSYNTLSMVKWDGAAWQAFAAPYTSLYGVQLVTDQNGLRPTLAGVHNSAILASRWETDQWVDLGGPALANAEAVTDMAYDSAGNIYLTAYSESSFHLFRHTDAGGWEDLGFVGHAGNSMTLTIDDDDVPWLFYPDEEQDARMHLLQLVE